VRMATFNATLKALDLVSDPTPDVLEASTAMRAERSQLIGATAALAEHFPDQHSQLAASRIVTKENTK
jgi:hypothetical protein